MDKKGPIRALWLAITTALFLQATPAQATEKGYVDVDQAIAAAQRKQPGKVLSASPRPQGGVYKVKVLSDDGVVRVITVDAHSGKVVSPR